jgi:hypothetical protein
MNKLTRFAEHLLEAVIPFVFGVRAEGIKLPPPTFRTIYPDDQPEEFEWNKMFRVSSLHGVVQNVYLDRPEERIKLPTATKYNI